MYVADGRRAQSRRSDVADMGRSMLRPYHQLMLVYTERRF